MNKTSLIKLAATKFWLNPAGLIWFGVFVFFFFFLLLMLFSPEVDKYILCMGKNEQHKFKYLEQVTRAIQLLSDIMLLLS